MTPYMAKLMAMYNNVYKIHILQSYTDTDVRLRGIVRTIPFFARKWYNQHGRDWYNHHNVDIIDKYFEKYLPEELRW